MFAVPGWSVSAGNLKVEKSLPGLSNKKRKRPSKDTQVVDADRIDQFWNKHIDGKTTNGEKSAESRDEKKVKKKLKREKSTSVHAADDELATVKPELLQNDQARQTKSKAQGRSDGTASTANKIAEDIKLPQNHNGQEELSKKEKKRKRKQTSDRDGGGSEGAQLLALPVDSAGDVSAKTTSSKIPSTLTPLQAKMKQKLLSSRFRHLNETLYTNPSAFSLELFKDNPDFFTEYHAGFRRQVESWPEDPKDSFLSWIKERGAIGLHNYKAIRRKTSRKPVVNGQLSHADAQSGPDSLPRDPHKGICTVADLGCGDGKLGLDITTSSLQKKLKLKILSYDLAASAPHITAADMKSLPLEDSSIDVAIFCLALMGTNWIEFVEEAYRVLRWKGECWIAEVASRFVASKSGRVEHSVGNRVKDKQKSKGKQGTARRDDDQPEELSLVGDEAASQNTTDVSSFVSVLERRGFVLQGPPVTGNKMFVLLRFVKALSPRRGKCVKQERREGKKKFIEEEDIGITVEEEGKLLKPCVYKLR